MALEMKELMAASASPQTSVAGAHAQLSQQSRVPSQHKPGVSISSDPNEKKALKLAVELAEAILLK